MQLSGIMQARKKLLFAALFIAILVPIFFALALRSQLAVINPADESPLITWLQQNMTSGGFWMKETGDGTSYSLVLLANNSRIGTLLFLQSHACTVVTFILLWLTLYCKKYYPALDWSFRALREMLRSVVPSFSASSTCVRPSSCRALFRATPKRLQISCIPSPFLLFSF